MELVGVGHIARFPWLSGGPQRFASGVGHKAATSVISECPPALLSGRGCAPCIAQAIVGVRHNENAVSSVRRTDGTSRNNKRPAGVAKRFQVSEHSVESQCDESRSIFSKHPSGPDVRNDVAHSRPEPSGVASSPPPAGETDGLARESATDEIDGSKVPWINRGDVIVKPRIGPMLAQDATAKGIRFALPSNRHPGPLQAEIQAADAGEQRPDPQRRETRHDATPSRLARASGSA